MLYLYSFSYILLCTVLWTVFLGSYLQHMKLYSVLPYIGVQILGGFLCPIFMTIAVGILAVVMLYITSGRLDFRFTMQFLIPGVEFRTAIPANTSGPEEEVKFDFWLIAHRFFIKAEHKSFEDPTGSLKDYVDKTLSTWLLTGIVVLSVLLATSYLINTTIVFQGYIKLPVSLDICQSRYCIKESMELVNCTMLQNFTSERRIYCFWFLETDDRLQLLKSVGVAWGLLLATLAFFKIFFILASLVNEIYHSRFWGIVFVAIGLIAFAAISAGYFAPANGAARLDIVRVGQAYVLCLFLVIVGVLLHNSSVKDYIKAPSLNKAIITEPKDYLLAASGDLFED